VVWQSELRLHVGERGQELLLDLQGVRVAEEFRFRSAMKRRLDEGLALGASWLSRSSGRSPLK
jgi:hypothetical protein